MEVACAWRGPKSRNGFDGYIIFTSPPHESQPGVSQERMVGIEKGRLFGRCTEIRHTNVRAIHLKACW